MKQCPVCQTPVVGRSDKKFCCDDCRASYHNERNRAANQKIRSVNRILRRNRKILEEFIGSPPARVPHQRLLERGFDFNHYTREVRLYDKAVRLCYDISYRLVEEEKDTYVIIQPARSGHNVQ